MKLVKSNGGYSVAVYNPRSAKAGFTAQKLLQEKRADYMAAADYTAGSAMERLVCLILDRMSAGAALEDLEGTIQ
jgi:hypothetical protein